MARANNPNPGPGSRQAQRNALIRQAEKLRAKGCVVVLPWERTGDTPNQPGPETIQEEPTP